MISFCPPHSDVEIHGGMGNCSSVCAVYNLEIESVPCVELHTSVRPSSVGVSSVHALTTFIYSLKNKRFFSACDRAHQMSAEPPARGGIDNPPYVGKSRCCWRIYWITSICKNYSNSPLLRLFCRSCLASVIHGCRPQVAHDVGHARQVVKQSP